MTKSRKAKQPKITTINGLPLGRTKRVGALYIWIISQGRLLAYILGTAVVILWTVLRHITNGVNYDVVGQIGVAEQWAHGQHAAVQFGATNYVLKLPLYFLINHLSFLSPMQRILTLAIICNITTFILLFWIFERIALLYRVKRHGWLNVGMLWLATIAGKVFWVDYANSRNLETVGGVLLLYLTLRYFKLQKLTTLVWMALVALVVFFADPLQLYIVGGAIGVGALGRLAHQRTKFSAMQAAWLLVALGIGFLGSRALDQLTLQYLKVSYLAAPINHVTYSWPIIRQTLSNVGLNTLRIFDADVFHQPLSADNARSLINAVILLGLLILILRSVKKATNKLPYFFVGLIIFVNYALYLATGDALQWQTSRYLIMIPLVGIALLATLTTASTKQRKRWVHWQYATVLACLASVTLLFGALVISWPTRHSKDAPIYANMAFMQEHGYTYGLSTREAGITVTYFSQGRVTILPMLCDAGHNLMFSNLFYDEASFNKLAGHNESLPIIIPTDGIRTGNNICTPIDIIKQFGGPERRLTSPNVGTALIYRGATLQLGLSGAHVPAARPHRVKSATNTKKAITILPPVSGCKEGTVDVIVAHPDDDLLFMNPSLVGQFADKCIRTVYITAADDGHLDDYWLNREDGVKAAYAAMAGVANDWSMVPITLDGHAAMGTALSGRPSLSLVFLRLPDGNVEGQGFERTGNVALAQAVQDPKLQLHAVDGSATYTYPQLVDAIAAIINNDKPTVIYTHVSSGVLSNGDHSDHRTVGQLVLTAQAETSSRAQIEQFVGYPSNSLPPNLSESETTEKRQIFYEYANDDGMICFGRNHCSIEGTYGRYFSRSYEITQPPSMRG